MAPRVVLVPFPLTPLVAFAYFFSAAPAILSDRCVCPFSFVFRN